MAFIPDLGPSTTQANVTLYHGRIATIGAIDAETGRIAGTVTLLDGPRAGSTVGTDVGGSGGRALAAKFEVGDEVVVQVSQTPDGEFIAVSDRWRLPLLTSVLIGFGLIVVLVGGWRGIRALIALLLTVGVVVKVVLPLILAGWDAVPLAVASASAVTVVTLLLTEELAAEHRRRQSARLQRFY